jgi:hypothetical protein
MSRFDSGWMKLELEMAEDRELPGYPKKSLVRDVRRTLWTYLRSRPQRVDRVTAAARQKESTAIDPLTHSGGRMMLNAFCDLPDTLQPDFEPEELPTPDSSVADARALLREFGFALEARRLLSVRSADHYESWKRRDDRATIWVDDQRLFLHFCETDEISCKLTPFGFSVLRNVLSAKGGAA